MIFCVSVDVSQVLFPLSGDESTHLAVIEGKTEFNSSAPAVRRVSLCGAEAAFASLYLIIHRAAPDEGMNLQAAPGQRNKTGRSQKKASMFNVSLTFPLLNCL